jgi:hypothetical protein
MKYINKRLEEWIHNMSILKNMTSSKGPCHILIVVSTKWQLAGFLMAARRHTPKKITIIKLHPFNTT